MGYRYVKIVHSINVTLYMFHANTQISCVLFCKLMWQFKNKEL